MGNPLNWKGDQKGLALHCGLLGVWSDSDIYHKYICSYHINVLIRFGLAINAFPLICESIVSCMISKLTWVIPMSFDEPNFELYIDWHFLTEYRNQMFSNCTFYSIPFPLVHLSLNPLDPKAICANWQEVESVTFLIQFDYGISIFDENPLMEANSRYNFQAFWSLLGPFSQDLFSVSRPCSLRFFTSTRRRSTRWWDLRCQGLRILFSLTYWKIGILRLFELWKVRSFWKDQHDIKSTFRFRMLGSKKWIRRANSTIKNILIYFNFLGLSIAIFHGSLSSLVSNWSELLPRDLPPLKPGKPTACAVQALPISWNSWLGCVNDMQLPERSGHATGSIRPRPLAIPNWIFLCSGS